MRETTIDTGYEREFRFNEYAPGDPYSLQFDVRDTTDQREIRSYVPSAKVRELLDDLRARNARRQVLHLPGTHDARTNGDPVLLREDRSMVASTDDEFVGYLACTGRSLTLQDARELQEVLDYRIADFIARTQVEPEPEPEEDEAPATELEQLRAFYQKVTEYYGRGSVIESILTETGLEYPAADRVEVTIKARFHREATTSPEEIKTWLENAWAQDEPCSLPSDRTELEVLDVQVDTGCQRLPKEEKQEEVKTEGEYHSPLSDIF